MPTPITPIPASVSRRADEIARAAQFNTLLGVAERRTGSSLTWEASGHGWGTLRTATGAHVCHGADRFEALRTAAGVSL